MERNGCRSNSCTVCKQNRMQGSKQFMTEITHKWAKEGTALFLIVKFLQSDFLQNIDAPVFRRKKAYFFNSNTCVNIGRISHSRYLSGTISIWYMWYYSALSGVVTGTDIRMILVNRGIYRVRNYFGLFQSTIYT